MRCEFCIEVPHIVACTVDMDDGPLPLPVSPPVRASVWLLFLTRECVPFCCWWQVQHPAVVHEGVQYPPWTSQHIVPLTHTGRFMDHLVAQDMIDFASGSWRTFQDYFRLILEFGQLGRQQRSFLLVRQVETRLLDMYLGNDSPLYGPGQFIEPNPSRPRKPMGTKQFAPDFSKLLSVASLLVRSFSCLLLSARPPSRLLCSACLSSVCGASVNCCT